jgi:cell division protein FtsB
MKLKKALNHIKVLQDNTLFLNEDIRAYREEIKSIKETNICLKREIDLLNARVRQLQDPEVISSYVHRALMRGQELDSEE